MLRQLHRETGGGGRSHARGELALDDAVLEGLVGEHHEAAKKTGSLITARQASEAGREVFAVPGPIHAPQSKGCHHLLKQGACLVQELDDLLNELPVGGLPRTAPLDLDPDEPPPVPIELDEDHPLLRAIGRDTVSLEQIAQRSGWAQDELNATLLDLELEGRVARLPGALFQRRRAT